MASELEDCDRRSNVFPSVATRTVRDQLYQLNVPKSTWPDGIHPKVLNELADVTAGPASTIY